MSKLTLQRSNLRRSTLGRLAEVGLWLAPLALATPCQAGPWFDSLFGLTPREEGRELV